MLAKLEFGAASAAPPAKLHVPVPVWVPVVEWAVIVGLVVTVARLGYGRWRRHRQPKVADRDASVRRWVAWVARRWSWEAQNLGLVLVDNTTRHRVGLWSGRALPPKVWCPDARFESAPNGLRCWLSTLPGVGLAEVTKRADHLANAWGCVRVDVTQESPGRLLLRGHLSDPLGRPWTIAPDGRPLQYWALHVGVDEYGGQVYLPLGNLSGITIAGVPGAGKTSLQRWWLCQLASHPAAQVAVLDGKVSDAADGDYGPLTARCFATAGDDLGDANQLLTELYELMRARSGWLRANRGTAQFWDRGPAPDCPLVLVVVDESHTYVTGASRKDRETCDSNVWYLTKLAKEGRARGFVTVFITQKQTADAIPTAIRDVCQVGISFAVRTIDGAVAALGDDIRQYPDIAPTGLIGRQWTGVAVMRLPDRAGYHRVRTPYVSEADATEIANRYAALRQTPRTLHVLEDDEVPA
jgi:S-DNA-T family DNA segregation ATPase FtsK/SpoIIIE